MFLFSYLAIKLGLAQSLEAVGWKVLYGMAVLCGITMSLFISSLASEP